MTPENDPQGAHVTKPLDSKAWVDTGISLLPECYDRAGVANVVSRPLLATHPESQISMVTRVADDCLLLQRFVDHALSFTDAPRAAQPALPAARKRKVLAVT